MDPDRDVRVDYRLGRALRAGTLPRDLVLCGPAGTGKSYGVLSVIHTLAADYPGLRVLLCRRTRKSLTESVMVTFERIARADGMGAICSGASRKVRDAYNYPNGTTVVLGGMDKPDKFTSTDWDIVFINEAIELEPGAWDVIKGRLGRPGMSRRFGFLIGDTNPGDPSHWIKKRCDEGDSVLWDTGHKANPLMWDGLDWTEAGRDYRDNVLAKLKGTRRKRFYEGLWAAGEGQWFEAFGDLHVTEAAEFSPAFPTTFSKDSGVHAGAVWCQFRPGPVVSVFADYYGFNVAAFDSAHAVLEAEGSRLCNGRWDRGVTDPAYRAATAVGPTVLAEYQRAGLRLDPWPSYPGSVLDGLSLIDSFVATDPPALIVHPRCTRLIEAFANYKRAKRQGQFIDRPEDPQHPHEDMIDALRGALQDKFPEGRKLAPKLVRRPASKVF